MAEGVRKNKTIEGIERQINNLPETVKTVSYIRMVDFEFEPILKDIKNCKKHLYEKDFPVVSMSIIMDGLMETLSELNVDGIKKYRDQLKKLIAPYAKNAILTR